LSAGGDRTTVGIRLLQDFLETGIIRGLTPDGHIFTHPAAAHLVVAFTEGIRDLDLKGVVAAG
jgi:hypothetical protein